MSTRQFSVPSVNGSPDGGSPVVHLRASGVSLVIDTAGPRLPRITHWGDDLGELDSAALSMLVLASRPPLVSDSLNEPQPVGVIAEASTGWAGIPGIAGHRDGTGFTPQFEVITALGTEHSAAEGGSLHIEAEDGALKISLTIDITLSTSGIVTLQCELTNLGSTHYTLNALNLSLPVPTSAQELLDFTGRHLRERTPQRSPFTLGSHVRTGRRGRTGADATLLMIAGEPGFGFETGETWGVHTAWSGNHVTYAERDNSGKAFLGGGEEILPGEVRLAPGESYRSPRVIGSYGRGLNALSDRFHRQLRSRPSHRTSPRLVAINTWEAVYFDHDLDRLTQLADIAAAVGAERYILDDGWFSGRRDDTAGLGDWFVDKRVWPAGLTPLVEHVRELGMDFGLWFEPEMISPDSDLARSHPDWIMSPGTRLPPTARDQQVLDLANPEAYAHILERMDSLITEYRIGYIKWDHNRDLVDAGHPGTGRAGVHDQTLAVYRMMDDLRARHPELEIESCSGGGSRADLEVLERAERIWASDCIDPLERQVNQRWTGLLLPPEMMGSHVGAPAAHTTHRTHHLGFRAGTAFFEHFGIEWDLTTASPLELQELATWVALYKKHRGLLHTGTTMRGDHRDPAHWVHGVVAQDHTEAIFAFVAMETGAWAPPGPLRFPGLDDTLNYSVSLITPAAATPLHGLPSLPGWASRPMSLSGRVLRVSGIQAPALPPASLQLIHLTQHPRE